MNFYLIDYENVNINGIKILLDKNLLNSNDRIFIFYSEKCKNINLEILQNLNDLNIKIFIEHIQTGIDNALDFQLSSYLGYMIGQNTADNYYIVSNDKGYDCLQDYWNKYNVSRISIDTHKDNDDKNNDTNSKILKYLKNDLNKDENPDKVYEIIQTYKTKSKIHNALVTYYKNNTKAMNVYNKIKYIL